MKPYGLVAYNRVKLMLHRVACKGFRFNGIHLFSADLKLRLAKDCDVVFEDRIISDGRMVIIVDHGAKLSIGKRVYFNEQAMISCKGVIEIGEGCKFGPNVKLFDNNHRFSAEDGVMDSHRAGEIHIGKNCWIGSNAVILKGAQIEDNCVVGAGCVVSGYVPKASIVTQGRDLLIRPMK